MEFDEIKSLEIIELTKNICEAVVNDDIDFVTKHISENLIFIEKFLGKTYKNISAGKIRFDKLTKNYFEIVSPKKPFVTLQNGKAKITFECTMGFPYPHKRFTFKGGFFRNVFHYSMIENDWKLIKVEKILIRFSRNNFPASFDLLRSFLSKYHIISVWK